MISRMLGSSVVDETISEHHGSIQQMQARCNTQSPSLVAGINCSSMVTMSRYDHQNADVEP